MPLSRMKKVWDYCTYNKAFFLLILILFFSLNFIWDYVEWDSIAILIIFVLYNVIISGYGMSITRDRINEGYRLPKIHVKDIIIMGVKANIVFSVYFIVQYFILYLLCSPFDFPVFDLEELLLELPQTVHMLFSHDPVSVFIFIIFGAVLFYVTTFFMEIALAKLADTGGIKNAFDLKDIKRDIDLMGWRNYAKDYTRIIIAILLFTYLQYVVIPIPILNYSWNIFLSLFVFATQFLGIGAVYSKIKNRKSHKSSSLEE